MEIITKIMRILLKLRSKNVEELFKTLIFLIKEGRRLYTVLQGKIFTEVSSADIERLILNNAENVVYGAAFPEIMTLDGKYIVPTVEQFKILTKVIRDNFLTYYKEVFDCDDFAWVFKAEMQAIAMLNNVGFVIGSVEKGFGEYSRHAWNIVILRDGDKLKVYTYEPQTNELKEGILVEMHGTVYVPDVIII